MVAGTSADGSGQGEHDVRYSSSVWSPPRGLIGCANVALLGRRLHDVPTPQRGDSNRNGSGSTSRGGRTLARLRFGDGMSEVIRVSRVGGSQFTVLSHHAVRNRSLSRRARGLLWEVLSLPPDWTLRHEWLLANSSDGKHRLQAAVTELRERGYLDIQRMSSGETVWLVTDDPDSFPLGEPHPENRDEGMPEPHPENPDMENRGVYEERTFLSGMLEEERGVPVQVSLLSDPPEVTELIEAVALFCRRIGVGVWPMKSTSLEAWCRTVAREVEYAGLDLVAETRKCGDHWEPQASKKKKAAPHMRLRNWWGIASQRRSKNGNGSEGEPTSDVARLHAMLQETSR